MFEHCIYIIENVPTCSLASHTLNRNSCTKQNDVTLKIKWWVEPIKHERRNRDHKLDHAVSATPMHTLKS